MMKHLITGALILFAVCVFAQIPTDYYDGTSGLTGSTLKSALNNIIDGHTELSYAAAKEALKDTDEDTLNSTNVICIYSGWSYAKTEFGNGSEQWNREHIWSKSHGNFGDSPPAGTDIHHLRPCDASVNSAKNNRDFDIGFTQYIDASGPTDCYYAVNIWEPRDEVKGDVARMLFYMTTRYEGENGEPDLELVDYVDTAPLYEPLYGKLTTLLAWHIADPVDDWERNRNDIIYSNYQGNRNPFIDHPEFVTAIWDEEASIPNTNLIISEVSDPSNAPFAKFVELYNNSDSTINFTTQTWFLARQANGGSWENVKLSGSVAAGETYIVSYRTIEFFSAYSFNANLNSSVASGNGNDGYFLYYGGNNTTGTLIDAFGVIDVNGQGEAWDYTNTKAVRIFNVLAPNSIWNPGEWFISSMADDTDMTPKWHHRSLEWNGNTSTDWHNPANWTDGVSTAAFAPDAGCVVSVVNAVNPARVIGEASCGGIEATPGGQLIIEPASSLYVGSN